MVLFEGQTEEQALPVYASRYWGSTIHERGFCFVRVNGTDYFPFICLCKALRIPWYVFADGEPGNDPTGTVAWGSPPAWLEFQGGDLRGVNDRLPYLAELGVQKLRMMTNNPRKFVGLEGYGLEITERISIEIAPTDISRRYLETKKKKLGHLLREV